MNHNFQRAEAEGIINSREVRMLYETAKKIYYPQRNYPRVLNDADLDEDKKKKLEIFLKEKGTDIKSEDARKVLTYIKNMD